MTGTLRDTYVAAIQHGSADVPPDARLIGVVRRPAPWVYGAVDENWRELGPPDELLTAVKDRHEELRAEGFDDAEAHNRAMADVGYDERYRTHLQESAAAKEAIDDIRELLADGEDVVLVCFENTDEKRCHRTILTEWIAAGSD